MIRQGQTKFTNPQGGAAFKVRVNFNAKHNGVKKIDKKAGLVTIDLTCKKTEINHELIAFLNHLLGVKPKEIEILDGATEADKVVCVLGQSVEFINQTLESSQ